MTYADFITLMMIFFIVLYTMTPGVEKNRWEAIIGVFQGSKDILELNSPIKLEMPSLETHRARNWEGLNRWIEREGLQESMQIKQIPEGTLIILGEGVLFETYSVKLMPSARSILLDVARGIDQYTYEEVDLIDVQGHTDNRPVVGEVGRYISNWELGAGRALSVMEYLLEKTELPSEHFRISSYGEYRPMVENTSPENMQKNRRVEIFIRYKPLLPAGEAGNDGLQASLTME